MPCFPIQGPRCFDGRAPLEGFALAAKGAQVARRYGPLSVPPDWCPRPPFATELAPARPEPAEPLPHVNLTAGIWSQGYVRLTAVIYGPFSLEDRGRMLGEEPAPKSVFQFLKPVDRQRIQQAQRSSNVCSLLVRSC